MQVLVKHSSEISGANILLEENMTGLLNEAKESVSESQQLNQKSERVEMDVETMKVISKHILELAENLKVSVEYFTL